MVIIAMALSTVATRYVAADRRNRAEQTRRQADWVAEATIERLATLEPNLLRDESKFKFKFETLSTVNPSTVNEAWQVSGQATQSSSDQLLVEFTVSNARSSVRLAYCFFLDEDSLIRKDL
jgi:type II secretory pathway pseudopilin PulG